MAFQITITADAASHLRGLPVRERRLVEAAVMTRLQELPSTPTRAIKRLRPNPFAGFELRVGDLRVLYNVGENEVVLLAVGRKVGNKLIVAGEEFHEHEEREEEPPDDQPEDNPVEPTGGGPPGDTG